MIFDRWVKRWHISPDAIAELKHLIGIFEPVVVTSITTTGESEEAVKTRVRLEASRKGCRLWKNNVGVVHTAENRIIRFGLANESAPQNKRVKSSDLIGIKPVVILPEYVGQTIGQFVAREIKHANWHYTGTDHEMAQLAYINLVNSLGGDAAFTTKEGTL